MKRNHQIIIFCVFFAAVLWLLESLSGCNYPEETRESKQVSEQLSSDSIRIMLNYPEHDPNYKIWPKIEDSEPFVYELEPGQLPLGIVLDSLTGIISGIPG